MPGAVFLEGDRQGEDGRADNPKPRTVTRVMLEVGTVTVEAEGPRGKHVEFWVDRDGSSMVFFGDDQRGPIEWIANDTKGVAFGPAPEPPD